MVVKPAEWVLIRGLGRESGHWGRFFRLLESSGVRFRPLDLPGAGNKWNKTFPLRIESVVDELRKEAGEGAEPRGLLALSLGAMVGLSWASRYPEDFSRVVVMNTSVASLSSPWKRFRWDALKGGIGILAREPGESQERRILGLISNSPERREEALPDWVAIARKRPVSRSTLLRQTWVASRLAPDLSKVKATGLVLASRADRLVDPSCSAALAERLHWPIEWHPTAGHDLPLDDPEWVLARL